MEFSPAFQEKYSILQVIGEGGMGRVYLAEERALQRKVAIKFLTATEQDDALAVDRFLQEARICGALKHPNIVPLYSSDVESGMPYMVFEFVEGRDLHSALEKDGPMTAEQALTIAQGVLSGLEHAHAAGVIHRDLKPQNILLRASDGMPMIADFGMAKREEGGQVHTKRGLIVGTPLYMAPEQIRGQALTSSVDLYAIGCTLYQMLTGLPPFLAPHEVGILDAHLNRPAPKPSAKVPGLPPDVDELIAIALDKKPETRFPHAKAMGDAVSALLEGKPLPVVRARLPSRPGAISRGGITRASSRPDLARVNSRAGRSTGKASELRAASSRGAVPPDEPAPAGGRGLAFGLGALIFAGGLAVAWAWMPGAPAELKDVRVLVEADGSASAEWQTSADLPGVFQCVPEDGGPALRSTAVRNQAGRLEARSSGLVAGHRYRLELRHGKLVSWSALASLPPPHTTGVRYPALDRAELDVPAGIPPDARLIRIGGGGAPAANRTGAVLSFPLAPADELDDLALEWPHGNGLSVRTRLSPAVGSGGRLATELAAHDPRPMLTKLVMRKDYRVDREEDGRQGGGDAEWWTGPTASKYTRTPFPETVRKELAGEAWLRDLESFRPFAKDYFAKAKDPLRLYEALLGVEHYDLLIRSQRETPELGIRDVYRGLVDQAARSAAERADPRDAVLLPGPSGWGTADRAQWDLFVFWWSRWGVPALVPGVKNFDVATARATMRPEHAFTWEGLGDAQRGGMVRLSLVECGLRPIYFFEVTFRSETGEADAGKPFRVRLSYPPEGRGWMAFAKEGFHGRHEGGGLSMEAINWVELSARFPARLLPRGKLAVRVTYEHLPGPTLRQLAVWHRSAFTREIALRVEEAGQVPPPSRTPQSEGTDPR